MERFPSGPGTQQPQTAQDAQLYGGKKRPADHELEQVVLGALMLEKDALTEVVEVLRPSTFDKEAHQSIFRAAMSLFGRSEPVDLMTVINELRKMGDLEKAGGPAYVAGLTRKVSSSANIVYHARILVQYALKREMIATASEITRDAYEDTVDSFDLLDKMETKLFEISEMNIRKNFAGMPEIINEVFKELQEAGGQEGLTGVPSGFTELDRVTSGWQRSDLIIIAARPAMGKTAFVLSALRNAAWFYNSHKEPSEKRGVAIFSLEMSAAQLVKRLISAEAQVESEKLKTGKMGESDWRRVVDGTQALGQMPIFIDDTPGLNVMELRAKCRRLKAQHNIQMVVIDYLQLMSAGDNKSKGNREQEIGFISRSLKQLAKELNVPVIALSQLSRAVETRGGDKRPQLSDLRESGSIEQDADMVMFLYRPEYYGITEDEEGTPTQGMGEVIIAKHRNGSLKNVRLRFIGKFTKFTDWEDDGYSPIVDDMSAAPLLMNTGDLNDPGNIDDLSAGYSPGETVTFGSKLNDGRGNADWGQAAPPFPQDEAPF